MNVCNDVQKDVSCGSSNFQETQASGYLNMMFDLTLLRIWSIRSSAMVVASTCAFSEARPLGLGLLESFSILSSILSHISPPVRLDRTCTLLQGAISDSNLYLPVKLAYYNIRSQYEVVDVGITAFDEEQLAGCCFVYDQPIMLLVGKNRFAPLSQNPENISVFYDVYTMSSSS